MQSTKDKLTETSLTTLGILIHSHPFKSNLATQSRYFTVFLRILQLLLFLSFASHIRYYTNIFHEVTLSTMLSIVPSAISSLHIKKKLNELAFDT